VLNVWCSSGIRVSISIYVTCVIFVGCWLETADITVAWISLQSSIGCVLLSGVGLVHGWRYSTKSVEILCSVTSRHYQHIVITSRCQLH
jgi:hypothetical protein